MSIAIENPAYAHIPRPPAEPVWWLFERRSHERHRANMIAVLARTWVTARATAMVLLECDTVDGDIAGEAFLTELDGKTAFAGPHGLFFVPIASILGTDSPAIQGCTLRAVATREDVRDVTEVEVRRATAKTRHVLRAGAEHTASAPLSVRHE